MCAPSHQAHPWIAHSCWLSSHPRLSQEAVIDEDERPLFTDTLEHLRMREKLGSVFSAKVQRYLHGKAEDTTDHRSQVRTHSTLERASTTCSASDKGAMCVRRVRACRLCRARRLLRARRPPRWCRTGPSPWRPGWPRCAWPWTWSSSGPPPLPSATTISCPFSCTVRRHTQNRPATRTIWGGAGDGGPLMALG